jgi:CheY-like chemotaxis protein
LTIEKSKIMHLSILDDNALDHMILEKMLSKLNNVSNDIVHYYHGSELLKTIEKSEDETFPDILFLDLHMPDMDGWTFLKHLNRLKKNMQKKITVYVLSSSVDPVDINKSKRYTFVKDYLFKPVSYEKLEKIFSSLNKPN